MAAKEIQLIITSVEGCKITHHSLHAYISIDPPSSGSIHYDNHQTNHDENSNSKFILSLTEIEQDQLMITCKIKYNGEAGDETVAKGTVPAHFLFAGAEECWRTNRCQVKNREGENTCTVNYKYRLNKGKDIMLAPPMTPMLAKKTEEPVSTVPLATISTAARKGDELVSGKLERTNPVPSVDSDHDQPKPPIYQTAAADNQFIGPLVYPAMFPENHQLYHPPRTYAQPPNTYAAVAPVPLYGAAGPYQHYAYLPLSGYYPQSHPGYAGPYQQGSYAIPPATNHPPSRGYEYGNIQPHHPGTGGNMLYAVQGANYATNISYTKWISEC